MENKKLTVIVSVLIAVIVLFILAMVFFRWGAKTATQKILENNPSAITPNVQKKTVVSEKEKIPSTVTGIVASIAPDKIVIKQFANFDLEYAINKSDVASVVSYQKNPDFDQAKLDAKEQELQKQLKDQGLDMNQMPVAPQDANGNATFTPPTGVTQGQAVSPEEKQKQADMQKIMDEYTKAMGNDPTLEEYIEKPTDFSAIKTGSQINFLKDSDGNGKIVVYPNDMNIGPPK